MIGNGKQSSSIKEIETIRKNLEEKGGQLEFLQKTFQVYSESYNATKLEFDNVQKDLNKELTYTNLVTKPRVADKKSYPIRWLIVLVSLVSANLFLLLIFVAKDFYVKIKQD
jgi:uncharacterized protein involved in exopolysaccharide biosynthesis